MVRVLVLLSRLGEPRAKLFKILLTDIYFSSSCLPGDIYATTEEERVRFAELSPDFLGHAAGSETRDILRCQEWCFSDTFHAVTFHRCSI